MRLSRLGELDLVKRIREGFGCGRRGVIAGIGDDAAVIRPEGGRLLATADMMLEGVHFDLAFVSPRQLGFKLISANVSDIYAMGGRPAYALLCMGAPASTDESFADGLLEGAKEALDSYGACLVGGDVSSSKGGIALSATLLGYAQRPVLRRGARPGDSIYVTGPLGESAAGLGLLKAMGRRVDLEKPLKGPLPWEVMRPLLGRHLMPVAARPPRSATSMMDISDGLFIDLYRLCTEGGVGARIMSGRIPVSEETRKAASFLGVDPLELACRGGEDYQLLFTARRSARPGAVRIGEVTASGMGMVDEKGVEREIKAEGYRHFAD